MVYAVSTHSNVDSLAEAFILFPQPSPPDFLRCKSIWDFEYCTYFFIGVIWVEKFSRVISFVSDYNPTVKYIMLHISVWICTFNLC